MTISQTKMYTVFTGLVIDKSNKWMLVDLETLDGNVRVKIPKMHISNNSEIKNVKDYGDIYINESFIQRLGICYD